MLLVRNLNIKRGGRSVINSGDIDIDRGQIVGLLGRSGSGKTSILRALLALEKEATGNIVIGKTKIELPVGSMSPIAFRARQSVSAFFGVESLRPYEKIRHRLIRLSETGELQLSEELIKIATALGVQTLLDRYPHELSMGQKARSGVLSVFAPNRQLIFLDEFGSNLDEDTKKDVFDSLDLFRNGRTFLISSHSKEYIERVADKIISIEEGKLVVV